jgi:predicted permease
VGAVLTLGLLLGPIVLLLSNAANLYVEPRRAMAVDELYSVGSGRAVTVSYPDYLSVRETLNDRAIMISAFRAALGHVETERGSADVQIAYVSDGFFKAVGARLLAGTDLDTLRDGGATCVVSVRLWRKLMNGTRGVGEQTLALDGSRVRVVGIADASFRGIHTGDAQEVWVPLKQATVTGNELGHVLAFRDARLLEAIARVPQLSVLRETRDLLDRLAGSLSRQYPETNAGVSFSLQPLSESPAEGGHRKVLRLLAVSDAIVLVAVVTTLAALGLARAALREQETATLHLLGARRFQLVAPIALEMVILAGAGAVIAGGLSTVTIATWRSQGSALAGLYWPRWYAIAASIAVAMITGIVACTYLLFRVNGESAKGAAQRFARRDALVLGLVTVAQVALAACAFAAALLILDGVRRARSSDPGFAVEHLLFTQLVDRSASNAEFRAQESRLSSLIALVRAVPGVRSAALGVNPVLDGAPPKTWPVSTLSPSKADVGETELAWVGPDYFATLGLRLTAGREFTPADFNIGPLGVGDPKTAVVSQSLASALWPGANAIGRTILLRHKMPAEVVGVVADASIADIRRPPGPRVYLPILTFPSSRHFLFVRLSTAMKRSPPGLLRVVQESGMAPTSPVEFQSVDDSRQKSLEPQATFGRVALSIASLAALIAAIGLYAALTCELLSRRKEVAIRQALGASSVRALAGVIGRLALFIVAGTLAGNVMASLLMRQMPSLTHGSSNAQMITPLMVLALAALAFLAPLRAAVSKPLTESLNEA